MTDIDDKPGTTVRRVAITAVASAMAALVSVGLAIAPAARAADPPASDDIHAFRLPADDPRTAVRLVGDDRACVLGQMRRFVVTVRRSAAASGRWPSSGHRRTQEASVCLSAAIGCRGW